MRHWLGCASALVWGAAIVWYPLAAHGQAEPKADKSAAAQAPTTDVPAAGVSTKTAAKAKRPPLPKFPPPRIFPEPTEIERRIAAALKKPIDVNWTDAQLGDVAVELAEKFDLPIQFDMAALTAEGKGSETLIHKSLRDVRLKNILHSVLDEQGLTFVVRNDLLLITSKTAAETFTRTRIYQVHDLAVQANDLTAAYPDFEMLIELITSTVAPETWREAGGTQGEIKDYYGPGVIALIITQTDEVHAKIEELLASMRAARIEPIRDAQSRRPPGSGLPPPAASFHSGDGAIGNTSPDAEPSAKPPKETDAFQTLVLGNTRLACDLYGRLAADREEQNIVFSPYGLFTTMSLVQLGARNRTADEIREALHVPSDPAMHEQMYRLNSWINANQGLRGYRLSSRNHLFTHFKQAFPASYLGDAIQFYDARIVPLDFRGGLEAAKARVLEAARRDAESSFDPAGIADDIRDNTKLAVLNTVYFRGKWADPFDRLHTHRQVFHAPSGDLRVEMMHELTKLGYAEVDGLEIVRKEYAGAPGGERAAFYVVLPPAKPGALAECEKNLAPEKLEEWNESIIYRMVELHLPKFKFEDNHNLKPILQAMGVKNAFDGDRNGSNADFSGMDEKKELYLENVRQKAKIEVNEQETEATAATTAVMGGYGGAIAARPDVPPIVRCDRPFLFFLRDETTGTILFLGRVAEPDNDPNAPLAPPRAPARQQGGGFF